MDGQRKAPLASTWSELPHEIICNIKGRLDSAVDVFQLRSVCKNWHSSRNPDNASILSPFLPRVISNVSLPFVDRPNDPVILFARAVFLVKPLHDSSASCGWLLTVEEIVPGKLRILYPLSTDRVQHLPSNCPKHLDLSKFNVTQVVKSYGIKYLSDGIDVPGVSRVVMYSKTTVMFLYGKGTVIGMRLKSGYWSYVRHSVLSSMSDIISYGGDHVRAVDFNGNVHIIDHVATKVITTISPKSVFLGSDRIIIFESNGELFAVACVPSYSMGNHFCIYLLDEVENKWIDVRNRYYCGKVLFVSSDWSFFVYTCELDLRYHSPTPIKNTTWNGFPQKDSITEDYVIYSKKSFNCSSTQYYTSHLYKGASIDLDIWVDFSKSENLSLWKESFQSTTTDLLWLPPTWFWTDPNKLSREDDELDSQRHNASLCRIDVSTTAFASSKQVSGANFTAVENSNALTIQNLNRNSSIMEFKGVKINSNLVPTLQKIWEKYGDIMQESTIRNADIVARALELLATAVIILQSNSGRSLNKDLADYLTSALCDLQQMKFKVDWLVPFVEKAIAVQKSKPLIDALKDFGKAKAASEEMKVKVLNELAKLDEVEEDMVLVYERLPVLKSLDFDQSLGDGLC